MSRLATVLALFLMVLTAAILRAEEKGTASSDEDFKLSGDEESLLKLTNAERAKKELPPLKANPLLFKAARAHSKKMAKTGEFSHEIDGKGPSERVKKQGYRYATVGENIAWGSGIGPKGAIRIWMNSDGHRGNILSKDYREVGLGIAESEKGKYFTQVFGAQFK